MQVFFSNCFLINPRHWVFVGGNVETRPGQARPSAKSVSFLPELKHHQTVTESLLVSDNSTGEIMERFKYYIIPFHSRVGKIPIGFDILEYVTRLRTMYL